MKAEIHEGVGLQYITIVPDEYTPESIYPLVIMLHGFGANMQDLAGLAPAINATGYVYACPNAPIPFQLGPGHSGSGWMTPSGGGTPEEPVKFEHLLSEFLLQPPSLCLDYSEPLLYIGNSTLWLKGLKRFMMSLERCTSEL